MDLIRTKKEAKKEHNKTEDKKADADYNNEIPLFTHVNNIMHSIFSIVEGHKQSANLQFKWTLCS